MDFRSNAIYRFFRTSLLARFALAIAVPIFVVMTVLSLTHYLREQSLLEEQLRLFSVQLGEVLVGSLRYAMFTNDRVMIARTLADVNDMENVQRVQLINLDGVVKVDSWQQDEGMVQDRHGLGCEECHRYPPESRPRTARLILDSDTLRITTPIRNEAVCMSCHNPEDVHLGVLVADVSLHNIEQHLSNDLRTELLASGATILLVVVGLYLLIHRLVVRRMVRLREPLARLADGDFSTRLPVTTGPQDELDRLTNVLNQMAERIEIHARQQEERARLRQQAIVEERRRIASELHDGMGQLLGYVNTKVIATRLLLKKQKLDAADRNLQQLEEAARDLFLEVREAILSLKVASRCCTNFVAEVLEFAGQFSELNGLPIDVQVDPKVDTLELAGETELQLMRIVQESLTNVRKHARAGSAWVSLRCEDDALELTIGDDGVGFNPGAIRNHRPHFGLGIMRERAQSIGATFDLDSEPGAGTRITVRLPLEEGA
ncbi:MAG: HAMP domain-containing protein [Caldilineae bacterium]|nr:MAG: HAMP domain-containing protein [Caldilineae bacterium]